MKEEELEDLEKKLWEAADKMRGAVPVSSYKSYQCRKNFCGFNCHIFKVIYEPICFIKKDIISNVYDSCFY